MRYDYDTEIAYRHEVLSRLTAQASPTWRQRRAAAKAAKRTAASASAATVVARDGKALRPVAQG